MVPELKVFLDVDDLTSGRGAEFVDASAAVLIFVSQGYFRSANCMRELLRAVARGKQIITLRESEANKGALTRDEVLAGAHGLRAADERYAQQWGDAFLQAEVRSWLEMDLFSASGAARTTGPDHSSRGEVPHTNALLMRGREVCEALAAGMPVAEMLLGVLFADDAVIEWNRIGCFQECA